ncbi:MAG: DEAD/DEAH box helicase [Bacteroidota bacterium]
MSVSVFSDLNLNRSLLNALEEMELERPTVIQERAFPVIMSGTDVVGIAQTGTGKTLAYLLPCLNLWKYTKDKAPSILILVPTRELVAQVVANVEEVARYLSVRVGGAYGGTNIKTQVAMLGEGLDVLVATPGRLLDLIYNGSLKTKQIRKLVVDEVDEMLNLGFRDQLGKVLDLLPERRQSLLFSATLTDDVEKIISTFFQAPQRIEAAPAGTPLANIAQLAYLVPNFNTKVNLLNELLADEALSKVLVFTASKRLANALHERLEETFADQVGVVHANKDQNYRFHAVNSFADGTYRILIATDLISRGLDIADVSHVINFDLPEIPENYIHRIGRTGRADKDGQAIAMVTPKDEQRRERIEELMQMAIPEATLPDSVAVSEVLTIDEMPADPREGATMRKKKREPSGPAFHEKKAKNKKVNIRYDHAAEMRKKYGKPRRKGGKKR